MRNGCHVGWLLVLVPACFHPSYDHPTCGPNDECPTGLTCSAQRICEGAGAVDSGALPDAAPRCFGSFVTVCFTASADVPTMPAMIPDGTTEIDTGSSPMCDQHNDQKAGFCVIAGASVTLSAKTIRAYGSKPLILLSTSTITIDAQSVIDVSSYLSVVPADPKTAGAGADPGACMSGLPATNSSGGYGGSFGGKGGNGEQVGGMRGTPANPLSSPPSTLSGGCPGGDGASSGGADGSGGGAVALIAATSIHLDGTVNASGAGGRGGPVNKSGGGGGGSGGMIVLDAPTILATGPLFANGGGGGQGGNSSGTLVGADGGQSTGPSATASGGLNTSGAGGSGGNGSSGTRLDGTNAGNSPAVSTGGGGGGGGGAGFIRAKGVTLNIAPPSFVP